MYQEQPTSSEELPVTLTSVGDSNSLSKKGTPWTVDEHFQFLRGLERLGRGNWRGISRFFVSTRTPTQVASHAQKHFLRVGGNTKRRSRFAAIEEEVYGGAPPAKVAMLTAGSDVHSGAPQPAARPPAALPPRAPHPIQTTTMHNTTNTMRPVSANAPGIGHTYAPQQQQLPPTHAHTVSRISRDTLSEGGAAISAPSVAWGNQHRYLAGPGASQQSGAAQAQERAAQPWMGQPGVMWPGSHMAMGQPVQKATPTTTSGSSGMQQPATSGGSGVAAAAQRPAAGVPMPNGQAYPMAGGNGPAMVPGYPAGAFFPMPPFMHPSMHPIMAYAMQAAGAAGGPAHGVLAAAQPGLSAGVRPAGTTADVRPQAARVSRSSASSSSSSRLDIPADAEQPAVEAQEASTQGSQHRQAEVVHSSRSLPCKPEATVVSWQPGSRTPSAIAPLLAQLQLAGLGEGVGGSRLQLHPSRASAFTSLAPVIRV